MMINTSAPAAPKVENEVAKGGEENKDEESYEQEALNYLSLAI